MINMFIRKHESGYSKLKKERERKIGNLRPHLGLSLSASNCLEPGLITVDAFIPGKLLFLAWAY